MYKPPDKDAIKGYACPVCNGLVHASGFTGRPFCWGKCYRYFDYGDLKVVATTPETAKEE